MTAEELLLLSTPLRVAAPMADSPSRVVRSRARSGVRSQQPAASTSSRPLSLSPSPGTGAGMATRGVDSNRNALSKTTTTSTMSPRRRDSGQDSLPPRSTLGQFSYAPATQTTVVTTTTTTTTSFPPLVMKPPRHLDRLDPKQYPLASSPTPSSLRSLNFDLGGLPTQFREAEDSETKHQEVQRENEAMQASNGVLRTVSHTNPRYETPRSELKPPFQEEISSPQEHPSRSSRKRRAPRVSLSEAAELARSERKGNKRRNILQRHSQSSFDTVPPSLTRHVPFQADSFDASTPLTPGLSQRPEIPVEGDVTPEHRQELPSQLLHSDWARQNVNSPPSPGEQQDTPLSWSPRGTSNKYVSFAEEENETGSSFTSAGRSRRQLNEKARFEDASETVSAATAATPPVTDADADTQSAELSDERPAEALLCRTTPSHLDRREVRDVSLPSPSLSPVTAAQQHGVGDSTEGSDDEDLDSSFELDAPPAHLQKDAAAQAGESCLARPSGETERPHQQGQVIEPTGSSKQAPSLMEIPTMLDSFDAMPAEMQSYVMHQFLRRCSLPTLQLVGHMVTPAISCDFLSRLPLELSLSIVRRLDLGSLCRAAQVSKRWRQIVNSDEKVWKEIFDRDGLTIPECEMKRAISEGWGWQHPLSAADHEHDLSMAAAPLRSYSEEGAGAAIAESSDLDQSILVTPHSSGRPKRKAAAKFLARKQQKRKPLSKLSAQYQLSSDFLRRLSSSEGPYAAATAAAQAIPTPSFGLPSLRNLHLYKTLYRRYDLIRQQWMMDNAKPRHIAFRAHERHVVTCLQFDSDKVLTGSDDTNIKVYDTNNGALRATLEGHEGGVWALQYHGNVLVSGSTDRSVRIWDIEQAKCTHIFGGHTSTVRCLQILMPTEVGKYRDGTPIIMPKQPLIITGSRDSTLRVWKLPNPNDKHYAPSDEVRVQNDAECPYFCRQLSGHLNSVRAIAAHGDTLVSGSYDTTVRVWKISTGETMHRLQGHTQKVYSVALDHERNRCVSGSMDYQVKIWSLETGQVLYNLDGHSSLVGLLDLSHGRLVSAAADSTLRIWDPENGKCKSTLAAHTGAITCFQHDGQKVISGSDRSLKLWNVENGEFMRDLLTNLTGVWQVKFDERRCVAAVQRSNMTYIEVLDFGAERDGIPEDQRGRRIVVNSKGREVTIPDLEEGMVS